MLSSIAVFTVMAERHLGVWSFVSVLLFYVMVFSLILYLRRGNSDPRRAEHIEAMFEHTVVGFATGAWLAFNLLPTLLIFSLLCSATLLKGGKRLLAKGVLLHIAGSIAGSWLAGWQWEPQTSIVEILGCFPLMLGYPLSTSRLTLIARREIASKQKRLELLSHTDGLTGLYNRAHWESQVHAQFAICQRSQQPTTLVLTDLDHFKQINDTYGHAAGDQVLRGFAELLRTHLREIDIAGRYGGEEFGILLPLASADQARAALERLRGLMHTQALLPQAKVTASFGIAEWSPEMADPDAWMRQADQMLYRAKHLGRDRICAAGDADPAVAAG